MSNCWDIIPSRRPTFKEIHSQISKYIGCIGEYMEMDLNPFVGMGRRGTEVEGGYGSREEGAAVRFQVTPPSVKGNAEHFSLYANIGHY